MRADLADRADKVRKPDGSWQIALDGPSGSGKSTVAKKIAGRLSIDYIDTGAMYRAIALKILDTGVSPEEDNTASGDDLSVMLDHTIVDFCGGRVLLDGRDVSGRIRTPEVTAMASRSSALPLIRKKLVAMQREMGACRPVVMDGRDIGTNVFPDAPYKFFITASAEERARRRHLELIAAGGLQTYDEVLVDINRRDYDDSNRALHPLKKAEDAILIQTDGVEIDAVTDQILKYVISDTASPFVVPSMD